jgi:hypothetical protein
MLRELGVSDTRAALREIRERVQTYLREMEIPSHVISAAMETDPGALALVNMNPSGTDDFNMIPSMVDTFTDECRIPSQRDRQRLPRLRAEIYQLRDRGEQVPTQLGQSFEALERRYVEAELCIWRNIADDVRMAKISWSVQRMVARYNAGRAEFARYQRETAERRLRERANRGSSTNEAPVIINIDGLGSRIEVGRWFLALPRHEQQATVHDIFTSVNGRSPGQSVRWTWDRKEDDPFHAMLLDGVVVELEEVGRVEIARQFLSMSSDQQRDAHLAVFSESRGSPALGASIPWRHTR